MISIGGTDLAMASIGGQDLSAISLGDTVLWTAATPIIESRSRMDAYPNTVAFPRNTWVDVPVDIHDYGDPIVGGKVVSSGTGEALVGANIGWIWEEDSDAPFSVGLTVNGVRIAEVESDVAAYATVALRKGDVVGAQIYSTAPSAGCFYDSATIGIWPAGFVF